MAESPAPPASRRHALPFAALLGRASDALDIAVFLAATSLAATLVLYRLPSTTTVVGHAVELLSAAQVGLFAWAIAELIRAASRRKVDSTAYPIGVWLVVAFLVVDRLHGRLFQEHLSLTVCREAYEAFRTGALPWDRTATAAEALAALVSFVILVAAFKALSFIPRSPRAPRLARRAAVPALLVIGLAASLRACTLESQSAELLPLRRAVPWDVTASTRDDAPASSDDHLTTLLSDARTFALIRERRTELLAHPPSARETPDILIVHVESLRADMLRPDVTPHLAAFAAECVWAAHHYTTGTNTGTGVFGILNGLTAPYYPLARAAHAQPLPLELLQRLGYELSVFFISNFGTYDGLYDLYFKGLASFTYTGPEQPVYDADAKMVDSYIDRLHTRRGDAPRFDYVVLDSTHYDYSYPAQFEKFTPQMTLELGIRDGITVREGINDEMKWRAPFIRNRYQNSILYADSLVEKMLDALRETHRLHHTIVVVTGDHGEEFWEHGVFGHGFFNLSNEQSRVPLLLRLPEGGTTRYHYTSHADLFPTIFDAMGLSFDPLEIMNGKSLLRYDPSLDVAVVGFGVGADHSDPRCAVVGDGLKVYWRNAPPYEVTKVVTDSDDPLPRAPSTARVDELVMRALAQKALR